MGCKNYASPNELSCMTNQGVIAVETPDAHNKIANFSTTGSHMSVCAPGVETYSFIPNNSYTFDSGTSMTRPFVAGVVSLMLEQEMLFPYEIIIRLGNSAVIINCGYKRVDA